MMNAFNAQGLANTSRAKAGHSDASLFGALEEAQLPRLSHYLEYRIEDVMVDNPFAQLLSHLLLSTVASHRASFRSSIYCDSPWEFEWHVERTFVHCPVPQAEESSRSVTSEPWGGPAHARPVKLQRLSK